MFNVQMYTDGDEATISYSLFYAAIIALLTFTAVSVVMAMLVENVGYPKCMYTCNNACLVISPTHKYMYILSGRYSQTSGGKPASTSLQKISMLGTLHYCVVIKLSR